jgi:hypothetical protein
MDLKNFEEFKKNMHFGKTSKLSENELEFCKKQYQSYLLKIEDDNYFEPLAKKNEKKYIEMWLTKFESSLIKETEVVILIMPSFEHPSLLKIEQNNGVYNLNYRYLENDFLQENYSNQELIKNSVKSYHNDIEQKLITNLWAILCDTIDKAQEPKSNTFTLDGVMFYIIKNLNGNIQIVSKNLTDITTKTGKITNLIEDLSISILNNTFTISLNNLQKKVEEISILCK